ncbi:thiamine monophosphate kinase [compost metagenome]
MDPALDRYAREAGLNPLELMLYGGEDYRLTGTVRGEEAAAVQALFEAEGLEFHVVGHVLAGGESAAPGVLLKRRDGSVSPLQKRGYNHFKEDQSADA